jgi:hypothetical protein
VSQSRLAIAKKAEKASGETLELTVQAMTIKAIINSLPFKKTVKLLSIDIEGVDSDVIKEIYFNDFRPTIVVCENDFDVDTNIFLPSVKEFFEGIGYSLYASTYVNSIFVDSVKLKDIRYLYCN